MVKNKRKDLLILRKIECGKIVKGNGSPKAHIFKEKTVVWEPDI